MVSAVPCFFKSCDGDMSHPHVCIISLAAFTWRLVLSPAFRVLVCNAFARNFHISFSILSSRRVHGVWQCWVSDIDIGIECDTTPINLEKQSIRFRCLTNRKYRTVSNEKNTEMTEDGEGKARSLLQRSQYGISEVRYIMIDRNF